MSDRAITAHTMAEVLEGRYNHKIRSVRVIDCRYIDLPFFIGLKINLNMFISRIDTHSFFTFLC